MGQPVGGEKTRFPAGQVYGGRSFQDALAAANSLGARMLAISAGLGAMDIHDAVPPYGCTVPPGVADSIATRVTDTFSLRQWWDALTRVSPFARQRFEITLENADSFRRETLAARAGFTPLGVVQG